MDRYKTLFKYAVKEIIIKKSKFLGYASPVSKEEDALEFIQQIRKRHFDATHNVYAYVLGKNGGKQRFSDDGEPSGTAGKPVLEVIKREELKNVVVVVTRYFGGIKLGAGGLIRAYSKSAAEAVKAAGICERLPFYRYNLSVDYHYLGKIQNEINDFKQQLGNIKYSEKVDLEVFVETDKEKEFTKKILNITNGNVKMKKGETKFLTRYNGRIVNTA